MLAMVRAHRQGAVKDAFTLVSLVADAPKHARFNARDTEQLIEGRVVARFE
jgi:hypothetical protein